MNWFKEKLQETAFVHKNIHGLHLRFSLYVSDVLQMLKIHMYQQLPTCRFTGLLTGPRLDLVNIEVKYGKFANLLPKVAIIYTYNQLQFPVSPMLPRLYCI